MSALITTAVTSREISEMTHDPLCPDIPCNCEPDYYGHEFSCAKTCHCELISKVRKDTINAAADRVNSHAMRVYDGSVKFEESAEWLDSWDTVVRTVDPPKVHDDFCLGVQVRVCEDSDCLYCFDCQCDLLAKARADERSKIGGEYREGIDTPPPGTVRIWREPGWVWRKP